MVEAPKREKYHTRTVLLREEKNRATLLALVSNLPLDKVMPLEIVVREEVKVRKLDQNGLMWVSQLSDIASQAYVEGRRFSAEVWHEHFKELYLPEECDPELTKEGYRKYDTTPSGKRVLIGSTTQLSVYGFSQYLMQIEAFGAKLGVMFRARGMQ